MSVGRASRTFCSCCGLKSFILNSTFIPPFNSHRPNRIERRLVEVVEGFTSHPQPLSRKGRERDEEMHAFNHRLYQTPCSIRRGHPYAVFQVRAPRRVCTCEGFDGLRVLSHLNRRILRFPEPNLQLSWCASEYAGVLLGQHIKTTQIKRFSSRPRC